MLSDQYSRLSQSEMGRLAVAAQEADVAKAAKKSENLGRLNTKKFTAQGNAEIDKLIQNVSSLSDVQPFDVHSQN